MDVQLQQEVLTWPRVGLGPRATQPSLVLHTLGSSQFSHSSAYLYANPLLLDLFPQIHIYNKTKETGRRCWLCGSCWMCSSLRNPGLRRAGYPWRRESERWVESGCSLWAPISSLLGILGNLSREVKQKCHSSPSTEWSLKSNIYLNLRVPPLNVFHSSSFYPFSTSYPK